MRQAAACNANRLGIHRHVGALGRVVGRRLLAAGPYRLCPQIAIGTVLVTGDCNSNSVTVTAPDLTATKTNSVSGSVPLSTGTWSWTVAVANSGATTSSPATFASGQTILTDHLPSSNITYGSPTPGTFSGITNSANISCGISSNILTCTASGNPVTIAAPGSFNVVFTATATVAGAYANPTGGACSVDPNNNVT